MSNRTGVVAAIGTAVLIGHPTLAQAAASEQDMAAPAKEDTAGRVTKAGRATGVRSGTPPVLPVWTPRVNRGAPAAREGGASRGTSSDLVVRTLVPRIDEAALTVESAPVLYWSISVATEHPVNLTLIDPEAIDPVLDIALPGPFSAGEQRLRLADHGARLAVGRRYEWFVAVVPDADRRSADTLARGAIMRIDDPALAEALAAAPSLHATETLARAGVWYEALASASALVESEPENAAALAARAALLEQAGLTVP